MSFRFYACFGTEEYLVNLNEMNGGNYHIMINNYYAGSINIMMEGWSVRLHDSYMFTGADNQILLDIIEREFIPAKLIK